nr:hypothetical protein GCM10025732_13630 [Glycomyces mayteni]
MAGLPAAGGGGEGPSGPALLPAGDVTFLFTDIEGSTRLASGLGAERYRVVLHRHRALVREVLRDCGGVEIDTEGDSFFVAFHDAASACAAAAGIQTALHGADWPDHGSGPLRPRVRMGLHTGEAWPSAGGYATPEVHRTARICSAAHGDQILASAACAAAAGLPPTRVRRLGDFELRGLPGATELVQIDTPGLPESFPPPSSRPRRHNLPHALKPPVDRPEDARELDRAFAVSRMVALSGLPGCGKTVFAKAWARKRLACYEHGVWYSDAGPDLGRALLDALDLRSEPLRDPMATVTDHFRDRRALLVVDGTDRLGAERRSELLLLLESCPELHLLAVGRRPIDLPGAVKRSWTCPRAPWAPRCSPGSARTAARRGRPPTAAAWPPPSRTSRPRSWRSPTSSRSLRRRRPCGGCATTRSRSSTRAGGSAPPSTTPSPRSPAPPARSSSNSPRASGARASTRSSTCAARGTAASKRSSSSWTPPSWSSSGPPWTRPSTGSPRRSAGSSPAPTRSRNRPPRPASTSPSASSTRSRSTPRACARSPYGHLLTAERPDWCPRLRAVALPGRGRGSGPAGPIRPGPPSEHRKTWRGPHPSSGHRKAWRRGSHPAAATLPGDTGGPGRRFCRTRAGGWSGPVPGVGGGWGWNHYYPAHPPCGRRASRPPCRPRRTREPRGACAMLGP